ncbi:MAG: peptidoglycan synthetase [Bacteroidia bacterium]|nr:peptidoglycan synthetase [Bacteroidia bacterium]
MKVHFIAIGGAAMHNIAIALKEKGVSVTGSDDEVFEPSLSRLKKYELLREDYGWDEKNISTELDAVILGMHARSDNIELKKAQQLGLKIFSFPEFIYEQSKNKKRVVIGGSHGKTTITAMIIHVLKNLNCDFDFMAGAAIPGFDNTVKLTEKSPIIILEGDEYLSSPIDRRPKFHLYKADIGLLSGIAWDHINVFPTFECYVDQFRIFAQQISADGTLVYCADDAEVKKVAQYDSVKCKIIPYSIPRYEITDGVTFLIAGEEKIPLTLFGEHNLQNIEGARNICRLLGVHDNDFNKHIVTFGGAAKRLQLVAKNNSCVVFKDFAHSPSKLIATIDAVKKQFPERKLVACMELHTFSSLNKNFLEQYNGAMTSADVPIVYYNPHTLEHKKLEAIDEDIISKSFDDDRIKVFTDSTVMRNYLTKLEWEGSNLLMMSSGTFDGLSIEKLALEILG